MAGAYPDAPGPRLAYDRDGSTGFTITATGTLAQLTAAQMKALNDEDGSSNATPDLGKLLGSYTGILFATPHDIVAITNAQMMARHGAHRAPGIQVSSNTTNGQDGTWTAAGSLQIQTTLTTAEMRNKSTSVSPTNVKGIRFTDTSSGGVDDGYHYWRVLHMFGSPTSAPDKLRLWHPTSDTPVTGAHFDWGDVARSTSADKQFRVRNPSALTAQSVAITTEALTGATPAVTSQHTFSFAGGAFDTTVNIGNISPGATSGVVTVRRTITSGAALGLWWIRIVAAAGSYV